jgi:hypothetical protein
VPSESDSELRLTLGQAGGARSLTDPRLWLLLQNDPAADALLQTSIPVASPVVGRVPANFIQARATPVQQAEALPSAPQLDTTPPRYLYAPGHAPAKQIRYTLAQSAVVQPQHPVQAAQPVYAQPQQQYALRQPQMQPQMQQAQAQPVYARVQQPQQQAQQMQQAQQAQPAAPRFQPQLVTKQFASANGQRFPGAVAECLVCRHSFSPTDPADPQ